MDLRHLTDKVLLAETKRLAGKEREITLQILHHLKEIEKRKLFSELGYNSIFDYAIIELGYSHGSASRRIQAARLLKELPSIEKKVLTGELNLSNIASAGTLFRNENIEKPEDKKAILKELEGKTSREGEKILLGFQSNPEIPKEREKQTTPEITTVKFNFSTDTMIEFKEVKNLLSHHRLNNDELFRKVFKLAKNSILNDRFKLNSKSSPAPVSPGVNSRYIPAALKKAVFERDKGKCCKCGRTRLIQIDHVVPYSHGGKNSIENLRLLCFGCNQRSGIAGRIINKAQ